MALLCGFSLANASIAHADDVQYVEGHLYHIDVTVDGTFSYTYESTEEEDGVSNEPITSVTKIWEDGEDHSEDSVTIYLKDAEGNYITETVTDENGIATAQNVTIILTADNYWTCVINYAGSTIEQIAARLTSGADSSDTTTENGDGSDDDSDDEDDDYSVTVSTYVYAVEEVKINDSTVEESGYTVTDYDYGYSESTTEYGSVTVTSINYVVYEAAVDASSSESEAILKYGYYFYVDSNGNEVTASTAASYSSGGGTVSGTLSNGVFTTSDGTSYDASYTGSAWTITVGTTSYTLTLGTTTYSVSGSTVSLSTGYYFVDEEGNVYQATESNGSYTITVDNLTYTLGSTTTYTYEDSDGTTYTGTISGTTFSYTDSDGNTGTTTVTENTEILSLTITVDGTEYTATENAGPDASTYYYYTANGSTVIGTISSTAGQGGGATYTFTPLSSGTGSSTTSYMATLGSDGSYTITVNDQTYTLSTTSTYSYTSGSSTVSGVVTESTDSSGSTTYSFWTLTTSGTQTTVSSSSYTATTTAYTYYTITDDNDTYTLASDTTYSYTASDDTTVSGDLKYGYYYTSDGSIVAVTKYATVSGTYYGQSGDKSNTNRQEYFMGYYQNDEAVQNNEGIYVIESFRRLTDFTTSSTFWVNLTYQIKDTDGEVLYTVTTTVEYDASSYNDCAGGDASTEKGFDAEISATASIYPSYIYNAPTAELEVTKTVAATYTDSDWKTVYVAYDSDDEFAFKIVSLANPSNSYYTLIESTDSTTDSTTYSVGDYTISSSTDSDGATTYTLTIAASEEGGTSTSVTLTATSEGSSIYAGYDSDGTLYTFTITTTTDDEVSTDTDYTLIVTTWPEGEDVTYSAYVTDADGVWVDNVSIGSSSTTDEDGTVTYTYGSVYAGMTVTLGAGETLHIVGLVDGAVYEIAELGLATETESEDAEESAAATAADDADADEDADSYDMGDYTLVERNVDGSTYTSDDEDEDDYTISGSIEVEYDSTTSSYETSNNSLEFVNATDSKTVEDEDGEDVEGGDLAVGDELTYTILWVNNATTTTTDDDGNEVTEAAEATVVITDSIPDGTEYVSASVLSIVYDGVTYTATEGTTSGTYTFTATVDGESTTLTYTDSNGTSQNVTATVTYPTTSTGDDSTTTSSDVVTWTITNAPAGSYGHVQLVVEVTSDAVTEDAITNSATVQVGNDSYTTNSTTNTVTGKTVTSVTTDEDGTTTEDIDGDLVGVGDELTYVIAWTNDEDSAATVTITDAIPDGTEYVSASVLTIVVGGVTYTATAQTGTDTNGDSYTYYIFKNCETTLTYTDSDGTSQSVTAKIELTYDEDDTTEVTKVTWTITNAPADSHGYVQLVVKVTSDAVDNTDNAITNQAGITVGNNSEVTTNKTTNYVPEKDETSNAKKVYEGEQLTYNISFTSDSGDSENTATATVTDTLVTGLTYIQSESELTDTYLKVDTYKVTVNGTATNNVTFTYSNGTLTWTITGLTEGDVVVVTFTVTVTSDAGDLVTNTAQVDGHSTNTVTTPSPKKDVSATTGEGDEATTTEDADGDTVGVGDTLTYTITYANGEDSEATVTIMDTIPNNTQYVDGTAAPVSIVVGGVTYTATEGTTSGTYTFAATDDDGTTTTLTYTDSNGQSQNVTATVTTTTDSDGNVTSLTWTITGVASGATGSVSFQVTVLESAAGTTISNQATVEVGNDSQYTNIVTNYVPKKSVTDSDGESVDGSSSSVQVGDTLTFTITFVADETSVTVVDTLDEGLTYVNNSAKLGVTTSDPTVSEQTLTWNLTNLTVGIEYTLTFNVTVTSTSDGEIENTATVGGHSTNTTSTNVGTGSLTLSKIVTGTTATDKVFTFTISLVDSAKSNVSGTYSFTGTVMEATTTTDDEGNETTAYTSGTYTSDSPGTITFTNGTATVYLTAGQSITITGLPEGANYTVSETNLPSGYTLTTTESILTGEISSTTTASVKAENSYSATGSDTLSITKTTGTGYIMSGGEFSFVLKDSSANTLQTVKNLSDGTAYFDVLTFTATGTYTYTITEVHTAASGFSFDGTVYTITYTVTDNGDGTLKVEKTITTTGSTESVDSITFYNPYDPDSITVSISGTKAITSDIGRTAQTGEFTFRLVEVSDVTGATEVGDAVTVTNTGLGFTFSNVATFTQPGTKYFKITEVSGSDASMTYDATTYIVKVEVTGTSVLTSTITYYTLNDDGTLTEVSEGINFTNSYNPGDNEKDVYATEDDGTYDSSDSIDGEYVGVGDTLTYVIIWVNDAVDEDTGANVAATVVVTDTIPTGTTYVANSATGSDSITYTYDSDGNVTAITWTISAAAASSGTVSFQVTVDDDAVDNENNAITNTATIKVNNNSSQSTNTTMNYVPEKTVTDEDGNSAADALVGETLTYTVSYQNTSETESVDITITDAIPAGTVYVTGSAATDAATYTLYDSDGNTLEDTADNAASVTSVSWTISGVAAGTSGTVSFQVTVTEDAVDTSVENQASVKIGDNEYSTNTTTTEVGSGELTISKTVETAAGETDEDDETSFTFTITLKDSAGNALTGTYATVDQDGAESIITFTNGQATVTLSGGQSLTIKGLPEGATYTVVETVVLGYKATVDGSTTATASGSVSASGSTVEFVNVASDITVDTISANLTKTISGREWLEDTFTFTLTALDGAPLPVDENGDEVTSVTVSIDDVEDGVASFDFGTITFTAEDMADATYDETSGLYVKTFTYTVSEVNGGTVVNGLTYSSNVATITITVYVSVDGSFNSAAVSTVANGSFTNTYESELEYATAGGLYITKTLNGASMEAGEFVFTVTACASDTVTAEEAAEKLFGSSESLSATFSNQAAADGQTVTVNVLAGDHEVTFDQDDAGKTYIYTVAETTGGGDGYTNDTTVYTVTISITDDGEGTLTATTVVSVGEDYSRTYVYKSGDELGETTVYAVVPFTNSYEASGQAVITATKVLEGRDLSAGEFVFGLTYADGSAVTTTDDEGEEVEYLATNDAKGIVSFTIDYDVETLEALVEAGLATYDASTSQYTIQYVLYESTDDADYEDGYPEGVSAGTLSYAVTVVVTDNGDGTLSAEVSYGEATSVFTNYFEADEATIDVNGIKVLSVDDSSLTTSIADLAGMFEFTISGYAEDDSSVEAPLPDLTTATNDAAGNVSFGTITYDETCFEGIDISEDGTYTRTFVYTVTESVPEDATASYDADGEVLSYTLDGVTYPVSSVTFKVTVTLDIKHATISVDDTQVESDGAEEESEDEEESGDEAEDGETTDEESTDDSGDAESEDETTDDEASDDETEGEADTEDETTDDATDDDATDDAESEGDAEVEDETTDDATADDESDDAETEGDVADDESTDDSTDDADEDPDEGVAPLTMATSTTTTTVSDETTADESADTTGDTIYVSVDITSEGVSLFTFTNSYAVEPIEVCLTDTLSITKVLTGRDIVEGEFTFVLVETDGTEETVVATGTNDAEGAVTLSTITYTTAGEHDYTLYEVSGEAGGVDYSAVVYWIHVSVTDNGDGTLTAQATFVEGDNVTYDSVTFLNDYEAEPTTVVLAAAKVLSGAELAEGQFTFQLIDAEGTVLQEATNDASCAVQFAVIEYAEAGVYEYTIVEVNDAQGGVAYDETVHTVTVTVEDNGEGLLVATVVYDEGDATAPVFVNEYATSVVTVSLAGVTKVLAGAELADGQFTFVLVDDEGAIAALGVNAADGSIVFSELEFSEAGVYEYTLYEVDDEQTYVTYDATVHTVTITVGDDGEGNLVATVVYDGDETVEGIVFTNDYDEPEEPEEPAEPEEPSEPVFADTGDPLTGAFAAAWSVAALAALFVAVSALRLRRVQQ